MCTISDYELIVPYIREPAYLGINGQNISTAKSYEASAITEDLRAYIPRPATHLRY